MFRKGLINDYMIGKVAHELLVTTKLNKTLDVTNYINVCSNSLTELVTWLIEYICNVPSRR